MSFTISNVCRSARARYHGGPKRHSRRVFHLGARRLLPSSREDTHVYPVTDMEFRSFRQIIADGVKFGEIIVKQDEDDLPMDVEAILGWCIGPTKGEVASFEVAPTPESERAKPIEGGPPENVEDRAMAHEILGGSIKQAKKDLDGLDKDFLKVILGIEGVEKKRVGLISHIERLLEDETA